MAEELLGTSRAHALELGGGVETGPSPFLDARVRPGCTVGHDRIRFVYRLIGRVFG